MSRSIISLAAAIMACIAGSPILAQGTSSTTSKPDGKAPAAQKYVARKPVAPKVGAKAPTGEQRAARLIAVLKSDANQKEKADACRELSIVGTHEAIAPLASLLADEKLGHMARYGLEPIPDPAVDDALRGALGHLKGRPLVGVIGSIGVRRDTKAVRALAERLKDKDAEVAQAAARALGRIGNIDAAKALEMALDRGPETIQLAVDEGLFRCAESLDHLGQRKLALGIYDRLKVSKTIQVRQGAAHAASELKAR